MKPIVMNQFRSLCGLLLAGCLWTGFAPSARSALFTGAFDPDNWEQVNIGGNDGGYKFRETSIGTVLDISSSSATGFSDTLIGLKALYLSTPATMDIRWSLTANGNVGLPTAYLHVGDTDYELQGTSGDLWGISIPASTAVYFELVGDVNSGKAPAMLEVTAVPEPGTILAGLFAIAAVAGLEWSRRKRSAAGTR